MTHVDEGGTQGAKRARWRELNPWKFMREVAEDFPDADREELWPIFWNELSKQHAGLEGTYFEAIARYFFDNAFNALKGPVMSGRGGYKRSGRKTPSENITEEMVESRALMLLNLTMPNGKHLGDCTGPECRRFGGWFRELAKCVPKGKTVSQALTETKARRLWNTTR